RAGKLSIVCWGSSMSSSPPEAVLARKAKVSSACPLLTVAKARKRWRGDSERSDKDATGLLKSVSVALPTGKRSQIHRLSIHPRRVICAENFANRRVPECRIRKKI